MAQLTREDWLQAQYSVLGSMLISPETVPQVMAETSERDFFGTCLTVYQVIRKLFLRGAPVDIVAISAAVGPEYRSFLAQLMDVTPTAANVGNYIALCREQAKVIAVRDLSRQMAEIDDADKLRNLLEKASGMMVDKPSLKIVTMADGLKSFMERHTRQTKYLTWPLRELNDQLYTELGDLVIIGGYPSAGKSAWALQCAWHWAKEYKVGFFSLETSSEKLFDRQMASVAQIGMERIKRNTLANEDWDKLGTLTGDITARNLELVPAAGMSPADIRAVTVMRGYQIILVDYLQLLQSPGENRTAQVTSISIALHTMAQSLGVTVVALSQLARQNQAQKQKNEDPDMSALRESGQIEQDADLIMMLSLADSDKPSGPRKLRVRKNKEGICPSMMLAFDGRHQTFSPAPRTSETVSKMQADGKRARMKNRMEAQAAQMQQMTLLPPDTRVPFEE